MNIRGRFSKPQSVRARARIITDQISSAILYDMPKELSAAMISRVEKLAEKLLN
jgi:hypothetical protein